MIFKTLLQAYVKSFNMCFDLEDFNEIFCALFSLIMCVRGREREHGTPVIGERRQGGKRKREGGRRGEERNTECPKRVPIKVEGRGN